MAAYHQMGNDSWNLLSETHLQNYQGAILSPVNDNLSVTQNKLTALARPNSYRIIFDPQLFSTNTDKACLRSWPYYPADADTADTASLNWWDNLLNNILDVCNTLGIDAVCSPAHIPRAYTNDYYDLTVRIGNALNRKAAEHSLQAIQTAVVSISDVSHPERVEAIASILTRTETQEIYLVFITDREPRRELSDPEELKGGMRLIARLEEAGIKVIVGFCSSEVLLWKSAGASSCATGKFFNLRRFTSSRFDEPTQGGGQLPYWMEESLVAYLRVSDLLRIQRDPDLLSIASRNNPFGTVILDQLSDPIRAQDPWLALSWRQYLYWFADFEERYSQQQVNVSEVLRNAERNWLLLEDRNVFMEEPRNDGIWLRAWRRALAEYNR